MWNVSSRRDHRFNQALIGLSITLVPLALLALAQYQFVPYMVSFVGGLDPKIDAWAVSDVRSALVSGYSIIVVVVAAYWLLVAALCKGQFLRIRSANTGMMLSGATFTFAMAVASTVPMPGRLLKASCPIVGLPDTMPDLPAGVVRFDGYTPCEAFTNSAVPIILLGLPLILLIMSAIVRIVMSRRHWHAASVPHVV